VTYYVGRHYYKTVDGANVSIKKFYAIGMTQIAVRTDGVLQWILTDHLSSASVSASADGTVLSEVKYTAFGESRSGSEDMPTKYQLTGQLSQMAEIGLHYFVARWMDPVTGHFVSADSIVPQPGAVHDWNRYAFGRYNPLIYTDPSGHCTKNILMDDGWCPPQMSEWQILSIVSIKWEGEWTNKDKAAASKGALNVAKVLGEVTGGNIYQTFKKVFGPITFSRQKTDPGYWGIYNESKITFYSGAKEWETLVPHELGHAFNARIANNSNITTPYNLLHTNGIYTSSGIQIAGVRQGYTQPGTGITREDGTVIDANHYWRERTGLRITHNMQTHTANEDFADMFACWSTDNIVDNEAGRARLNWLTTNMSEWIRATGGQ